ncbi:MAG: hypothetical protein ABR955_15365 [Verrucomicrobiota bacterium]
MIDCVVKKQSITMRRAAQERKPQPDSASQHSQQNGIAKLATDNESTLTPP